MLNLNLKEVRDRIHQDRDWQSRSIDIEIFHFELMLIKKNKWSIRKTAKTLDMCASTVCEDLMLSKFTLKYPDISKIKKRNEALGYVKFLKSQD